MSTRLAALLLLVAGGVAWELPEGIGDLLDGMHRHHAALRAIVQEHIRPLHRLHLNRLVHSNVVDPDTCGACHRDGAKFLMEGAMGKLKELCHAAPSHGCDKMARVCALMAKKPNVTMGMVFEHIRPLSLTTAYCFGKGKCSEPDNITMSEIDMGAQPHMALLDNFDQVDWDGVLEEAKNLSPDDNEQFDEADASEEIESSMCMELETKVCPMCLKRVMKRVMYAAVGRVKKMCMEKVDCPIMKKMCSWAAERRQTAFGMLLAKVEPWKFAIGFCMHRREEKHSMPARLVEKVRKIVQQFTV